MKKTLVIGASTAPDRYSFLAINKLVAHGHPTLALGRSAGTVAGVGIATQPQALAQVDTVTLYVNPKLQEAYQQYIFELAPKRVIFNPGTENPEFETLLKQRGIETSEACTLVLLATNQY
ncbi:MAG: CoA-binding protein [Bacteroidetes bacterium]|nr:MAG: CoA-binding protein [Bacteroidota bacterium]